MKKLFNISNKHLLGLLCIIACIAILPSCESGSKIDESIALAPKNMNGREFSSSRLNGLTIKFKNNNEALSVSDGLGTASTSKVSYERTSEVTAKLKVSYTIGLEGSSARKEQTYNLILTFESEKKGTAEGRYSYTNRLGDKSESGSRDEKGTFYID